MRTISLIADPRREWLDCGGVNGYRDIGAQDIDIFARSRVEDLERKVFQGGIETIIYFLPALQEDRVIVVETELLGKMMKAEKEAGRGKISAMVEPVQARVELAYMYLVGKGVIGQDDRKGDNRPALPVSDIIFSHPIPQAI